MNIRNGIIGRPIGQPIGQPIGSSMDLFKNKKENPKTKKSEAVNEVDSLTFYADSSGCAHYRLFWPESILRSRTDYNFTYSMRPPSEYRWYSKFSMVRIQRQVSDKQLILTKFLKQASEKYNFRLVYEIDDLPIYKYIPDYNQHKKAYSNPIYKKSVVDIINCCDEVTTTTKYLRDILKEETGHQNITVIPNFVPRLWMGMYYDENKIKINFSKNKNKPRILYAGSGAHYSMDSKIPDDFTAIVDLVRKTYKEFQWVFYGGFPRPLSDLLHSKKIEYHKWVDTMSYSHVFNNLKVNVSIAPLIDNTFNRCKSDIKFTESCAYGLPSVCQDMVTYKKAINKFNTADDLYNQLKRITKDSSVYMKESRKAWNYMMQTGWMEDNMEYWESFFKYPYGHEKRNVLTKFQ